MRNWLRAGKDFTHCEKNWCGNCSQKQQMACEKEVNEAPKLPKLDKHLKGVRR